MKTLRIFLLPMVLALLMACNSASQTPGLQPTISPTAIETATPTQWPTLVPTKTIISQPTASPQPATASLMSTVQPTATLEPSSTIEYANPEIPGRIYVWSHPEYGYLDPRVSSQDLIHGLGRGAETDPGYAQGLGFSNYSEQVAYLLKNNSDQMQLWVADLELQNTRSLWVDEEHLLGKPSRLYFFETELRWGPGNRSLLMEIFGEEGGVSKYYRVVYSIEDEIATPITGICNRWLVSPKSGEFALGCPVEQESLQMVILEQDGTQWQTDALPDEALAITNWALSPDGKRALLADENGQILVIDQDKNMVKLPFRDVSLQTIAMRRALQWSRNGSRILMFGDDLDGQYCERNEISGLRWCWLIFDTGTWEVLWASYPGTEWDATLSPDSEWVVYFYMGPCGSLCGGIWEREGVIDRINGTGGGIFYTWTTDAVSWGETP